MTNEEYLLELSSRGELSAWLGAEHAEGARCKPMDDLMAECAEHERIVDRLTAKVEELREVQRAIEDGGVELYEELPSMRRVIRTRRERELERENRALTAQREELRGKLSRAMDNAADTLRLGDLAAVDVEGEVR